VLEAGPQRRGGQVHEVARRVQVQPAVAEAPGLDARCVGHGDHEQAAGQEQPGGVSQRRTRQAARFQSALYRQWEPSPLARLLRLDDTGRAAIRDAAVGTGLDAAPVVETFLRHLPA